MPRRPILCVMPRRSILYSALNFYPPALGISSSKVEKKGDLDPLATDSWDKATSILLEKNTINYNSSNISKALSQAAGLLEAGEDEKVQGCIYIHCWHWWSWWWLLETNETATIGPAADDHAVTGIEAPSEEAAVRSNALCYLVAALPTPEHDHTPKYSSFTHSPQSGSWRSGLRGSTATRM